MSPSPDQDSHNPQVNRPKVKRSNSASTTGNSYSMSPFIDGSGIGLYARDSKLGCGPQVEVLCKPVRSEDLLHTNYSETI